MGKRNLIPLSVCKRRTGGTLKSSPFSPISCESGFSFARNRGRTNIFRSIDRPPRKSGHLCAERLHALLPQDLGHTAEDEVWQLLRKASQFLFLLPIGPLFGQILVLSEGCRVPPRYTTPQYVNLRECFFACTPRRITFLHILKLSSLSADLIKYLRAPQRRMRQLLNSSRKHPPVLCFDCERSITYIIYIVSYNYTNVKIY